MPETKTTAKFDWFKIGSVVLNLALAFLLYQQCNKTSTEGEQVSLVKALQDTLQTLRLENGSQQALITTIKTEQVKTFTSLNIKDKEIQELQAAVKQYEKKLKAGSSVSRGTIETNIDNDNPTIIVKTDTVRKDSLVYIWPTYMDSVDNRWINYKVVSNRSRTRLTAKIKNDFSVVVGSYKGVPFADLTTNNPYSEVKSFRTYQVTMPKVKRWGIGPNVSGSLNTDFKFRGSIGIGLQYNIIQF